MQFFVAYSFKNRYNYVYLFLGSFLWELLLMEEKYRKKLD